ncbi:SNF2 domain-containing protein CLASSY 2-like [Magnolia sinica]|uniref:SNF2 domain-containing protein CLASSY 2-like n=1 Tax=Magnolia sinica TaxID=86752 RepID=UPI00265A1973|nr:SNF2 domain-containing protein CLASSY 2-like [Magnolia sinica]
MTAILVLIERWKIERPKKEKRKSTPVSLPLTFFRRRRRRRRNLTHPYSAFEAFLHGSWWKIKHVKIKGGSIIVQYEHHGLVVEEKVTISHLRICSRKASVSDCRCFLRFGMDVCVFSAYPNAVSSDEENLQTAWHDAKIISIERKPHASQCTCQFSVIFYRYQDQVGMRKRKLVGGVEKVSIDDIAILQKLGQKSDQSRRYQCSFSEDCSFVDKSKLPGGMYISEISWLLVLSSLNGMDFDIRSIGSKMEYLIVNGDHGPSDGGAEQSVKDDDHASEDNKCKNQDVFPLGSNANVKVITFQRNNGISQPMIETFAPVVPASIVEAAPIHDLLETDEMYDLVELRRSKRRRIMPDRYNGYSSLPHTKCFSAREVTPKGEDVSPQADKDISEQGTHPKEKPIGENVAQISKGSSDKKFRDTQDKTQLRQGNSGPANLQQNHLSENHEKGTRTRREKMGDENIPREVQDSFHPHNGNKKNHIIHGDILDTSHPTCSENTLGFFVRNNAFSTPKMTEKCPDKLHDTNQGGRQVEVQANHVNKTGKNCHKQHRSRGASKTKTKKTPETKDTELHSRHRNVPNATESRTKLKSSNTEIQRENRPSLNRSKKKRPHRKHQGLTEFSSPHKKRRCSERKRHLEPGIEKRYCSERKRHCEPGIDRQRFCSMNEWKQIMERRMQNIKCETKKQHPCVVSQWEANRVVNVSDTWWEFNWMAEVDDPIETLENEDLWEDMENSMVAFNSLNAHQDSSIESSDVFRKSSCKGDRQPCQHEYKLDEEVGIVCLLCNVVKTEIRYVSPPFLQKEVMIRTEDKCDGVKTEWDGNYNTYATNADPFLNATSLNDVKLEHYKSVWALIPDFKMKLLDHQKKAFEFLWKNIAGSLNPRDMECMSKKCSGCVISHSPGTGKTLLVISFLISYLKLFPRKRPLILAPKTTLYAWYKEFEKWDVSIPIYQIHAVKHYRNEKRKCKIKESVGDLKLSEAMMHLTDCLEKLWKWHEHPSILLMSYSSFFYMTREDSKVEHRRYMAGVLRQSPGILILDEGHNPRSTKSKLRRVLMEVKTDLRILLSGTLFQNNFEEYFNTLCLARPAFISEMAREFNLRITVNGSGGRRKGKKITSSQTEMLARRTFVEQIARSINSSIDEERKWGLSVLKKITNVFIDVYNGGTLDRLPGLQCYTLLMKSTDVQERILSKLDKLTTRRCCLELELLITAGSIHPWLIKAFTCARKYFSMDELEELERYRHDVKKGPKMLFVVDLMHQCIVKREKVLIFCRNIPPIYLFVEIFKSVFGWQKDKEVLVLQGDQDLITRSKVMDKFKEAGGTSRVLLASTTACAEGISLTAASRVVLLDPEWNPSKTKQAIARAFRPGQERVVYVYRLMASGTLEEEKYNRNELKERQSRMIFTDGCVEDSYRKTENIDDHFLRELVEADRNKTFKMIMKHEKVCSNVGKGNEELR